jgi:ribosomal 30S subunit maturation factor RimM
LVGLQARDTCGAPVGRIEAVLEYPASNVLQVATPAGTLEVPLRSPYFVEARLEQGLVIVDAVSDLEPVPPAGRRRGSKT